MTMPPPEPPPPGDEDRPAPPPEPSAAPPPPPPPAGGYGSEPPGAYGTQPGYGAPQPGYEAAQPGYGAQQPGYGPPPGYPMQPGPALNYVDWPKRALSGLIDFFGPFIVAELFYFGNRTLGILLYLVALAWALYNAYLGGQTGQSYGKRIAGTRLISEATGQSIGGGLGVGRFFVHIVDSIPCYLGYLWPLWDAKRQTFADKLLKTVVVPV